MSENRPSNFDPGIHVVHYADEFRAQRLDHRTLINDFGRQREPLDGEWSFVVDQYDSFLRLRWFEERERDPEGRPLPRDYDFEAWERMPVPSCWNVRKPDYLLYEGSSVYTRTFPYKPAQAGRARQPRVFLKVGAANYECFVFLNKRCLGSHLGGSTPFFVEVTPHLLPDNRISLVVNNRRESFHVPADNTDWFNYGGLYRSVELIYVPETFIKTYQVSLVPGGRFGALRAMVDLDGSDAEGEATLRIPELAVETRFAVSKGLGACELEAYPKLWSPESPKLYNVEISYSGGSVTDVVRDRVGFREIATRGTSLLLNGKPIYLRGVSCHEDSVENGKAVSPSEIRGMLETVRELGCNFLRLAHYPHAEEAARMADELGMLLWEEIPVYWAIDFANPETFADAYNQLSEARAPRPQPRQRDPLVRGKRKSGQRRAALLHVEARQPGAGARSHAARDRSMSLGHAEHAHRGPACRAPRRTGDQRILRLVRHGLRSPGAVLPRERPRQAGHRERIRCRCSGRAYWGKE